MSEYQIDSNNSLFYLHFPPAKEDVPTFVFVNALTGSTDHWEAVVAPGLRDQGFGTLSYNFRGQDKSSFDKELELTNALIVDDLVLIDRIASAFETGAGRAFHRRALRRPGLRPPAPGYRHRSAQHAARNQSENRLDQRRTAPLRRHRRRRTIHGIDDAPVDQPEFAMKVRSNFLTGPYEPLDPTQGHANLMRNSVNTDWSFDWASLDLPVLNITGLHDQGIPRPRSDRSPVRFACRCPP